VGGPQEGGRGGGGRAAGAGLGGAGCTRGLPCFVGMGLAGSEGERPLICMARKGWEAIWWRLRRWEGSFLRVCTNKTTKKE